MTTLFDHTGLPLWVYIVIISVGSILLLVILAVALRCWVIRRNARRNQEMNTLTGGPIRRVTLRRGRVVPSSQHLSLTGSKFGMRQFGMLADNESTMTGRRSPFEWWSTIMDRSQSRQDRMSQIETGSISTRPGSRATTIGTRRELLNATPTLTPEKEKEPVTKTWEVTIPSPLPSPSPLGPNRNTNFSRSFSNRAPSSPVTQRSQLTLSRISERSPHQSMISTAQSPTNIPQGRSSHHSAIKPLDNTPLPGLMPQPSPTTPRSMTLTVPAPAVRSSQTFQTPQSETVSPPTSTPSRKHMSLSETATERTPRLSLPRPVASSIAPAGSQSNTPERYPPNSFYRQPNPSRLNLTHSRMDSTASSNSASTTYLPRQSFASFGPTGIFYETQVPQSHNRSDYWSSRGDVNDVSPNGNRKSGSVTPRSAHSRNVSTDQARRSHSSPEQDSGQEQESRIGVVTVPGKRNTKVLRKKSLKRMQMQVATSIGA